VIVDMGHTPVNAFFWWPDKDGNAPNPQDIKTTLNRWTIDPKSEILELADGKQLLHDNAEFFRIDDRYATRKHSKHFFSVMDPSLGTDFPFIMSVMGGGFPLYNSLAFFNSSTGKCEKFFGGPHKFVQECVFIPRGEDAAEGDGFVMALLNNYESMASELVVLDTRDFTKERALIMLPLRLRPGLHGNWVDDGDVDGHPSLLKN
jgi:carotenoid cleavage dioxygenase-like enzyme